MVTLSGPDHNQTTRTEVDSDNLLSLSYYEGLTAQEAINLFSDMWVSEYRFWVYLGLLEDPSLSYNAHLKSEWERLPQSLKDLFIEAVSMCLHIARPPAQQQQGTRTGMPLPCPSRQQMQDLETFGLAQARMLHEQLRIKLRTEMGHRRRELIRLHREKSFGSLVLPQGVVVDKS